MDLDLDALLNGCKNEAFRLEVLPEYRVEGEWEIYQEYIKSGVLLDDIEFNCYVEEVANKVYKGCKYIRARVLDSPLSDYQKFEILSGYRPLSKIGAKIIWTSRSDFDKISINRLVKKDFWIFDDNCVVLVNYDSSGEWLGFEQVEDKKIAAKFIDFKNLLLATFDDISTLEGFAM